MTKRDTIQRIINETVTDGEGGQKIITTPKEFITVAASISAEFETMDQFGIKKTYELSVVSDNKLDDRPLTRYEYSGKLYKIMRQVKRGNEYFSTLVEIND